MCVIEQDVVEARAELTTIFKVLHAIQEEKRRSAEEAEEILAALEKR